MKAKTLMALAGLAITAPAMAVVFPEIEPNESKAQATANGTFTMSAGDALTGTSTGSSTVTPGTASADTWRIKTAVAPLGIYRHRLVITTGGTAGHTGTIRGLTQSAGVISTTDTAAQTSSSVTNPPRFNQWYGFGKGEELYYRVTGTTSTTAPYNATLETMLITPTNIGSFLEGQVTITTVGQGHTTDTDMWVYDSNFNAIDDFGNDDEGPNGSTLQSRLVRNYTPGTYYLALTNFNLANHEESDMADEDFKSGTVLDFAGAVLNSSTTTNLNMTFSIQDSDDPAPTQVPNTKVGPFDINWFCFTVVPIPTPGAVTLLGLAGFVGLRRRR